MNEIDSEYEYFAAHPDERKKILLNLNQDMVGARQSIGSRIQHITRTPWSRPSFLDTVVESIATMVMRGNSAYLAAGQAGSRQPFSKPIVSRLGTRERYGAEIVSYFDSTDHLVFNDGIVGVPGVTFTNWPDEHIHSSDDDLWQMDPTQLQRNAFIVVAAALYFANLDSQRVPALAWQIYAGALRDLAGAHAHATEMLSLAPPGERPGTYFDGANLIAQAGWHAAAAMDSVQVFEPEAGTARQVAELKKSFSDAAEFLAASLGAYYCALAGCEKPPARQPSDEEQALAGKVPVIAASLGEFREKRGELGRFGLHELMRYEVWNFVDGKRSYLDIYRAVRAEAQSVGTWYYGNVTAKQVAELLDAGVEAGLLRLQP